MVERVARDREPIYLHVPPSYARNWRNHCDEYDACGERVYFVQDSWYTHEYAQHYHEHHAEYEHEGDNYNNDYEYDYRHNGHEGHHYNDDHEGGHHHHNHGDED